MQREGGRGRDRAAPRLTRQATHESVINTGEPARHRDSLETSDPSDQFSLTRSIDYSCYRNHLLLNVRQPVVVTPTRAFFFTEFLPYTADSLRCFPEREAFGVVAQVEVPPIENLPHVARVTRVETYPRRVR